MRFMAAEEQEGLLIMVFAAFLEYVVYISRDICMWSCLSRNLDMGNHVESGHGGFG